MTSKRLLVGGLGKARHARPLWSRAHHPLLAGALWTSATALTVAALAGCQSGKTTPTAIPLTATPQTSTLPAATPPNATTPTAAGPTAAGELYRKSYQLEAQGKPAEALEAAKQIRREGANTYFLVARIAWLAYLAGRYAESSDAYRDAIKLAPAAIEPRLGLTLPLLALKKWRELEAACREVLQLDPNNAVGRARLAHANYMVGNYPDAATLYRKLVDDYPADLDHQTGLGWALARMGRVKEGKEVFGQVLAVSPDNPNAQQGMALP
jgi:tetratricopeptide (TPR) repeat protein